MVSKIFAVDSVGNTAQATLTNGDVAFVRKGIFVSASEASAIAASGSSTTIRVEGSVVGRSAGIYYSSNPATEYGHRLTIIEGGEVGGFSYGVYMSGYAAGINNAGSIWSNGTGIMVNSTNADNFSTNITNSGTISGSLGIRNLGSNNLYFKNSGIVETESWSYYSDGATSDTILNTGTITSSIGLYGGSN